jgi:hypothetical protein
MSNEQSSHQRLAAYYAGQHDTWGDLRREAENRGLSVMELVRMRAEESQARLREGRMPTPAELGDPEEPARPDERPPSSGRIVSPPRPHSTRT